MRSIHDFFRFEVNIIRRNASEIDLAAASQKRKPQAFRMKVPVITRADAVALQKRQDFRALISMVFRRIVQKAELFMLTRCL